MIYIQSEKTTPRLRYVVSFIFEDVYSVPYRIFTPGEMIPEDGNPCIMYGCFAKANLPANLCISIPSAGLLFEEVINPCEPIVTMDKTYDLPVFFRAGNSPDFEGDLFAMVFFCLTRYEEYFSVQKDRYGRFPASASLASKNGFLNMPVVDRWLDILIQKIERKSGHKIPRNQKFTVFPTIDIDIVWAYAYKGKSNLPGLLKDFLTGHILRITRRFAAIKNPVSDPFFTFEYLDKNLAKSKEEPLYFVLYSKNPEGADINHPREMEAFRSWLKHFSRFHNIGLHPSFQSHRRAEILQEEKSALESSVQQPVRSSRQHYILFRLPETYRRLEEAGIQDDYSMGYPDNAGYRASTGYSYQWYDLEREKVTGLKVHPFQIMDVTLRKYMELTPEKAINELMAILDKARKTDSPVRFIWHNSSFYNGHGWKSWEKVFEFLARQATG